MDCKFCEDQAFEIVEHKGHRVGRRCPHCERGRRMAKADALQRNPPKNVRPVVTESEAKGIVALLAAIPMFPADATVRGVIGDQVRQMCQTVEDAFWMAQKMIAHFRKWPGVIDMRGTLCSGRLPHDGIMASVCCEEYPDGLPREREPEPATLALPPGASVSALPELDAAVGELARTKDLAFRPPKPAPRVVTQADIEAAMEASRSRREARTLAEKEPV